MLANVTCAAGYELQSGEDSTLFTCGLDGTWQGSAVCKRVSCGPFIPGLDANSYQHACLDYRFEDTCIASCKPGYQASANTDGTYTCDEDGEWTGDLVCEPISCGTVPSNLTAGISMECENTTYGSTCDLQCDAPLFTSGSGRFQCIEDGTWIGGCELECLSKPLCVICPQCRRSHPSSFCMLVCNPGMPVCQCC